MIDAIVLCDGAVFPRGQATERVLELRHLGPKSNVNLAIESPSHALRSPVDAVSSDLLRIAAYAYGADQGVSRGGDRDVYGRSWIREFQMHVPVSDPDLWLAAEPALCETLGFLSGDHWSFAFSKARGELGQVPLKFNPEEDMSNPDAICLVSGGLDSLCAAVEARSEGRRPVLVGHEPAFHIENRRAALVRALRTKLPDWQFPDVSAAIHRTTKKDAPETTQRTRSFLYATLGSIFAHRLGIADVILADNGIVSLNLPINAQLAGTLASRSTHLRFIRLFNNLLRIMYGDHPVVRNPLWSRTRPEALEVLKTAGATSLIPLTLSCAHSRLLRAERNHCGACSQCIDRRFATVAAGLEDVDPAERYVLDCFRGALDDDRSKTMVLSYHDFAIKVSRLTGEGLFQNFEQLYDAIPLNDSDQNSIAQALIHMLHRHAETVIRVVEDQIVRAKGELARRQLPPNCLLTLLGGDASGRRFGPTYRHSENYQSVTYGQAEYSFSPAQACVVCFLDAARRDGPPARRHKEIITYLQQREQKFGTSRVSDLFRGHPAWGPFIQHVGRGLYQLPPDLPT